MNSFSPFSLMNKNIIVTGASSGIGRQCAISCSIAGARVVMLGRNKERLEETRSMMQNPEIHSCQSIDLNEFREVNDTIKNECGKLGRLHGLVNAAGISVTLPLRAISPEKIMETLNTNVISSMNLTKMACQSSLKAEEGLSVVFITSVMGIVGESGKTIYGMSKGALIAASKSLAIEYASKKVRFNCISPGVVITPMSMNSVYSGNESTLERIKGYHPLGLGTPEDVANGVIYLLSDASRWVTGTNLVIDGGYTAR